MAGSKQKADSGYRSIVTFHPNQVKCFVKSKILDDYKPGVKITIDGCNIVIQGKTEKLTTEVRKKIEKQCSHVVNDTYELLPALGKLLTKDEVRQYIDNSLGTEKKAFAWGVDIILDVDTLMVFALTAKDASEMKRKILACVTKTQITKDTSSLPWFQDFLEKEGGKISVQNIGMEDFIIYTTSDLYEKYLKPHVTPSKDATASVDAGRKSKSPAPQPPITNANKKGKTKTKNTSEKQNGTGKTKAKKTEGHTDTIADVPSSQTANSQRKPTKTKSDVSGGHASQTAERKPDYDPVRSIKEDTIIIKFQKPLLHYVEEHHNSNMADISERWNVRIKKPEDDGGLSLTGARANLNSAINDLNTLFDSLSLLSLREVCAGKPCAPEQVIEDWKKVETKESCLIKAEGFMRPHLKSGWIYDKENQKINLLFVGGKINFCAVDIVLCPVSRTLEPIGVAKSLLDRDHPTFSCDENNPYNVGDILHVNEPENLYCHCLVLHILDKKKLGVSGYQIKELADSIITSVIKDGLRSFGFCLKYSKDQEWFDYTSKLVQWLVSASDELKTPLTVYCFGEDSEFECLDRFLFEQLKLQKTLNPVVIDCVGNKDNLKSSLKVKYVEGSILEYDMVDVMVNSVKNTLELKHGIVSKLLLQKGGQEIQDQCKKLFPDGIDYGDVAVTSAGKLNFKKIFHVALYTIWIPDGHISVQILKTIVIRCLKEAERKKLTSISFPALGTGTLGYPPLLVAKTMQEAIDDFGRTRLEHLKKVVFVLFDGKDSIKIFEDVEEWLRLRRKERVQWDLPPKHVMYKAPGIDCRVIITERDYYGRMAYKELRVAFGSTSGKGLEMAWDPNDGCYVTKLPTVNTAEGTKANMMDIVTLMQSNKLHVVDLFLETSRFPAQKQIEILIDEINRHETSLHMRNSKLPKDKNIRPEVNYVKIIRIFLHLEEYSSIAEYYGGSVSSYDRIKKWYMTEMKTYPYTVEVVGLKGKVEKVFKKVCDDVSSLEPSMKSTWQIKKSEAKRAKKIVDNFKKENLQIVFEEDSHCVICEGTHRQLEAVSKELEKIVDLNLYYDLSMDDFVVLLGLTNEDNWRANVSKPQYEKGRAIFTLNKSADVHHIRTCIDSKLKVIHQFSSIEIFPPNRFEDQFDAVKAKVEGLNMDGGIFCFMGFDGKKILIKSENYQLLQQAKHVAEVELGMIQATPRRNRVIATDEYSQGSATNQGINPDSSVKQGKHFKTAEGIDVLVYSAGIGNLQVDTLVNAANKDLQHGGGIAYHISSGAGYELDRECDDYIYNHSPLRVGTCVSTTAGKLPYKSIIHAVGPMWHSYPQNKKQQCLDDLKQTVVSAITEAASQGLNSIALPAISSGIFGVPKELCTDQYYRAVIEYSRHNPQTSIREIHFIDKDRAMCTIIQKTFEREFGYSGQKM